MDKQKYQDFLRQIKQCQQRSQRTLNSIDSTLQGVQDTLKDINQTHKNIDKIKEDFNSVMTKLAENVAKSFIVNEEPFKKKEGVMYQNLPKEISQKAAIQQLIKNKKILILTGAGVSVDSGIPTFRGINGLYSKNFQHQGESYTPQQFITLLNYKEHPQRIWKWVDEIYSLSSNTKPNQVHRKIHQLACRLSSKGFQVVLVTQNIDDLHIKPQNNQYEYYAIHGNCKLVRCSNHHFAPYSMKIKSQRCPECNQHYRPHVLFFDESYGMNYGDKVKDRDFPFVITIGSSLKTGLAIKMIQKANQIIEINPEPVIEIGKVYHFKNDTAKVLKNLNQALNII